MVSLVCLPLVHQPRLDEKTENPFAHRHRLRLQGRQEFGESIHGEVDPFCEFHERQGVPLLGRPFARLGDLGVEFCQQVAGYLVGLDGVCDATEEPGLEGFGGIGHCRLHRSRHHSTGLSHLHVLGFDRWGR